ncbi:pre-mRNA-processing factor 39-like [Carcharodon carcharias]|uniref:pre-mRNA-processing factor 39-like n=1 Tax=Carcharodon carcharias TaxID=13397 RepID=UPI001B7F0228|nr:pre-mRNA-processing factor 39-like [Carcharodon carcharias]
MVTGVMEAAENPWSGPEPNPPASAPSGDGEQKLLKGSLDGNDQCAVQKGSTRARGLHADETAVEEAIADCPSPCDRDSGEESAADTPGSSDGATVEDPAADSTGDTGEESAADSTGEESATDSKGPNDSGEESAADSTGPSDGDTVEEAAADSPGPCDGDTVEEAAADSPGPCDGDTVEEAAADSPGPCDGDTVEEAAADSPGPCDGDTVEEAAADSPGPCDGDTVEEAAADSPGPCDGDTVEEAAADSPGPCDGDTVEEAAADSPGPCDGDTVEEAAADSPGPCDGDTVEEAAADSPGPCDGDTVEEAAMDSPGPCDGDTVEEAAADSPGPCDGDTVEEAAVDSPGPCDGDIVEEAAADSTGQSDGDMREEAAAGSPGHCDMDTVEEAAADSLGPCDMDTVEEAAADSLGPCDMDTIEEAAAGGLGPCDRDTVEETAAGSPGPCDTDTVEVTAAGSPGPCATDTVEEMAACSPGLCDDTVDSPSPRDCNEVEKSAAESPSPSGVQSTAGELSGSLNPPCDQDIVPEVEIGGPSIDKDIAEESANECTSLGAGGQDTVGELAADSSSSTMLQEGVPQLPESSSGPEHVVDKTLANSDSVDYTTTEGTAAAVDEYGQGSSEYGALESEGSIPPYPADFEKYWKIVEDNPYDFTGWTYVLQYVEQENHIWAVRKAFDAFFARYPYCYGYWKKYADIEKRLGFTKEVEEVYQRGLQSIPLSVDLWVHYITYLQEVLEATNPETPAKLRSVFEMALAAAGTDFRSDRLWDLYVNWEKEQGQLKAVTAIYDRVLSIPTQLYSHHFEKFKEHVQNYSPKDILSTDEFLKLRSEVVTSLTVAEADCDEGPPGDDPPPGVGTTDEEKADTELEKIRAHLVATRHEMYLLNEEEVSKRWNFEEAIKRPYFHVKPLERVQLKNWKDYLDFEIASGTNERVLVLFERCMIACALYEDFWIKYAKYLENHSVEGVRNVFQRACMVHLPKKPTLHLLWAAFEEQQGDLEEARRILKSFQMVVPGLAMVLLRRVSLERRCGHLDQAEELLREAIEQHRDTALASFFSIKLARQLLKVQKSLVKARKVLLEAVERDKENTKLYLNLLELEFSGDVRVNEANILGCFEQVLISSLPLETKIVFSQRRVEFLEDFGCNVQTLLHAYDEHQKLLKQNSSKKRAAENGTEEPEEKKARVDDSSTGSIASTATTTTNSTALMSGDVTSSQAAYNYSAWYQPYGSYGYQNPWNYSQYYSHS